MIYVDLCRWNQVKKKKNKKKELQGKYKTESPL